ncbi:hypothetical protein HOA91_00970 [Candidatus Woesearchaeota archaeon]|nr:hypothetical protein [Candidatus Woesearchaeota archaeon]
MNETIAIVFIFFVLILFGIMFFYQYQKVAIKEKNEELLGNRAMDTTLKTLFLPELICTKGEAEPEDNCFDLMKLRYAEKTFTAHLTDYYYEIFSYAKITVQEVYPGNKTYLLYDKEKPPQEDGSQGWTRKEPTYFVVTLKDENNSEEKANYGFGYINIEVYS